MTNLAGLPPMGLKAVGIARYSRTEQYYFRWLHTLSCALTGNNIDIQIAHTGGLREGKGMRLKAPVNTCLPIHYRLHLEEEKNRAAFWKGVGFDPVPFAERLFEIYEQGADSALAFDLLWDTRNKANQSFIAEILMRK